MRLRHALLSLVAAIPLLGALPACAQLWLDAAVPDSAALGPANALGAVVWSHGRSVDAEDSTAPTRSGVNSALMPTSPSSWKVGRCRPCHPIFLTPGSD